MRRYCAFGAQAQALSHALQSDRLRYWLLTVSSVVWVS